MSGSNRESADIAIIGGGIMGTSLAWQLARRGAGTVTLYERAVVAAGASGKTGAGRVSCWAVFDDGGGEYARIVR